MPSFKLLTSPACDAEKSVFVVPAGFGEDLCSRRRPFGHGFRHVDTNSATICSDGVRCEQQVHAGAASNVNDRGAWC
jgi:hypothetical protein